MKADAGLFEQYALAHRLGIGVTRPLRSVGEMPFEEFDNWAAYFFLTGDSLRLKDPG